MTRYQASLKHLLISAAVVSSALALIWFGWYPDPMFRLVGAWNPVKILVGVDLILGPLLTLIVYRAGKKWLWIDLSIIAVIQLAALGYGLSVIYSERPCYMVYAVDRYELKACSEITADELARFKSLDSKSFGGLLYVLARLPSDPDEFNVLLEDILFRGAKDIALRPEFWESLSAANLDEIRANGLNPGALNLTAAQRETVESYQSDALMPVLLPGLIRDDALVLITDPVTLRVEDFLRIDPWGDNEIQ